MKIVISGWYGRRNLGDELILDSLIQELKACGAVPVVLSADPESTARRHPGIRIVPNNFARQRLQAFRSADGVMLGGGGLIKDLSGEHSGAGQFLDLTLAATTGAPTIYFGISCDKVSNSVHARTARDFLGMCAGAVVRDSESAEALAALGMPPRVVTLGCDPVLLWDDLSPRPRPSVRFSSAIILSSHGLKHIDRTAPKSPALGARVLEEVAEFAIRRGTELGLPVVLPVFCREPSGDDLPIATALAEKIEASGVSARVDDVSGAERDEVAGLLAEAHVVLSARFHGCLVAALAGTPIIALGLEQKTLRLGSKIAVASPAVTSDELMGLARGSSAERPSLAQNWQVKATRIALADFVDAVADSRRRRRPSARPLATFALRRAAERTARRTNRT